MHSVLSGHADVLCTTELGRCIVHSQDRQVYGVLCALPDPGQAGVLCTARTGRWFAHCQDWQVFCVHSKEWQVHGVLCTFRTGRFIVHCQDLYC